jgi:hypothetical protein
MNEIMKAIDLLLYWLAIDRKELEGNDELWLFYQELSDDLNKLSKMIKEKEQQ